VLAGKISNPYQLQPVPANALEEAVARYNSFVDAGKDADFGKPGPKHKIQKPPFYAAWSTPILHDCLAGLRINRKCQVIDLKGPGHTRTLLLRRIGRWICAARPAESDCLRSHRRPGSGAR
jgi:hypothetical protein